MTAPIGDLVSATHVRAAIEDTLQGWLAYYLAEACRAHGLAPDHVGPPKSWQVIPDLQSATPDQYPALLVTSSGLAGPPTRDGDGKLHATWNAAVHALIRGQSYRDVADTVGIYTAAIRAVCVQHPTLGGLASTTDWRGETYDLLDARAARTLGGGRVDLQVKVGDVLDTAGPVGPPPASPLDPPDPDGVVASVHVDEQPLVHPAFE